MKGDVVISCCIRYNKEEEWWIWGTKRALTLNDDDVEEDNTYNRVMMSEIEMPLQRKENDKHKAEDDDVPEEINE